jgi:hypothetical protein
LRQIEEHDREQPKEEMRLPKFRSSADPARADHKQYLGENKVAQSQGLLKGGALLFDIALCTIESGCHDF